MWLPQLHQQSETFHVNNLQTLDVKTQHRLKDLGLTRGKKVTIIRRYPLHGPVIISFDHQKIGLRWDLIQSLKRERVEQ
uniref:Ferrous iron transporter FeoA-like domain-containing protein n=1 Tax=Loigolactobacillus rennini TaxID=238013 RepID=A0A1K2I8Z8_9LACO|nr:hypothetical protein LREN565_1995 [Loigolactobacillus rennini]